MTYVHGTTRPGRGRRIAGAAFALLLGAGLTACGDDGSDDEAEGLLQQAQDDGITIGIANERPYGYEEDGEATGEAPELARAILERLDVTDVDFEVVEFGALINGLSAGRFDMIAAGMFITPERAEQVDFVDPDYCATTAFAVPDGNPLGLSDFASIITTGARLGVLSGAVEEGYAGDSGVPGAQVSAFQTTPDVFDALTAGRIDAVALTAITVREQVADLDGFEATEGFVPVIDGVEQLGCGGFAFALGNDDIVAAFNEELDEMQADDEVLPVIERFGFTSAEVEAAEAVTAAELAEPMEPPAGE